MGVKILVAKVIKHAKIATGTEIIDDGYVRFTDKILDVGTMAEFVNQPEDQVVYAKDKIIVPGFIDVHCHGGYGYDTMDGDSDKIDSMVHKITVNEGVTSFFCTTMTQSVDKIDQAMKAIKQAAEKNKAIAGIHLEGPFISAKFKGAQPEEYIIDPDYTLLEKWNELSGGLVKMISFAPEKNGSRELENYCVQHHIVPSVGHSEAKRTELLESKVSHTCHLYNAQSLSVHREPGVMGHTFLEDNIYAELIMDGFHNCPDMLELAYREKGPHKIELVTDAMRSKGLGDGESELGCQKVWVKGVQARLKDGTIAGSVLPFNIAFKNCMKYTDAGLFEAVLMSSVNQAVEFGLESKGDIAPGKDADLNVLDQEFNLLETYNYGALVTD